MKKSKLLKILAFILCLVLLLCLGIAFWLPSFIMTGERQTLKEAFNWQSQHYDTSFYEKLKKQITPSRAWRIMTFISNT